MSTCSNPDERGPGNRQVGPTRHRPSNSRPDRPFACSAYFRSIVLRFSTIALSLLLLGAKAADPGSFATTGAVPKSGEELYQSASNELQHSSTSGLGPKNAEAVKVAQQHFHRAYEYCVEAANLGHAKAELQLGRWLLDGGPCKPDPSAGLCCLLLSAKQGEPAAFSALGSYYSAGKNAPPDLGLALKCLQEAMRLARTERGREEAEASLWLILGDQAKGTKAQRSKVFAYGRAQVAAQMAAHTPLGFLADAVVTGLSSGAFGVHSAAEEREICERLWEENEINLCSGLCQASAFRLATLLSSGDQSQRDYGRALRLFTALAGQGDCAAQANLAAMYSEGLGTVKDPTEALAWSSLAAVSGEERYVRARDELERSMTADSVAKAQSMAKVFSERFRAAQPVKRPSPASKGQEGGAAPR